MLRRRRRGGRPWAITTWLRKSKKGGKVWGVRRVLFHAKVLTVWKLIQKMPGCNQVRAQRKVFGWVRTGAFFGSTFQAWFKLYFTSGVSIGMSALRVQRLDTPGNSRASLYLFTFTRVEESLLHHGFPPPPCSISRPGWFPVQQDHSPAPLYK
jgi:hypothetical protein